MRILVLVSLLFSFSIHAQTFEQITFIRLAEQQGSVRGTAMGGVSDDDPLLNPAALGGTKRAFLSLSAVQLEPLNGSGLSHALAVMPLGRLVVAAHYRATPHLEGSQPLLSGGSAPRTEPVCDGPNCAYQLPSGSMFEREDRRYGVSAAWTAGRVTLGGGAEVHELDESTGLGLIARFDGNVVARLSDLTVLRVSGREVVPNAGIRVRVTPRVAFAAAYNGGTKFSRVVEACQLDPAAPLQCQSEFTRLTELSQRSPSALRAAVTVQASGNLTVTGEAVRRNYSEIFDVPALVTYDPYRDVTELHAGAEYRMRNVALRAGWWRDPVRYDDLFYQHFSPLGRSADHFTLGAGVDVSRTRLEFAVDNVDDPAVRRVVLGVTLTGR